MKKGQGFGLVSDLVVIVVITVLVTGGTLIYRHNRNKTANSTSSSVNASTTSPTTSSTSSTNQNIKKIPELGIQITVPDSIKDLTYTPGTVTSNGQSMPVADFSTQSLTVMEPACASTNQPSTALGRLAKTNGQYPADASTASGKLVKQFSTYYIISYNAPQASCAVNNGSAEKLRESQVADFQAALSSVQQI